VPGVKELVELYLHSLNTPPWRSALLKHRDNFTFTFKNSSQKELLSKNEEIAEQLRILHNGELHEFFRSHSEV
jgi:hypothetical protein